MQFHYITLCPDIYPGPLAHGVTGRALKQGLWSYRTIPLHQFGKGVHRSVDDGPYGGGSGMVLRPDVLAEALDATLKSMAPVTNTKPSSATSCHATAGSKEGACLKKSMIVCFSANGHPFTQQKAMEWAEKKHLVMICPRFEGVDERLFQHFSKKDIPIENICVGDYILSNGDLPALTVTDAVLRHCQGVLGNAQSLDRESFQNNVLEHPHYTKPAVWEGLSVPKVLTSGHHDKIEAHRKKTSLDTTERVRPDLWEKRLAKDHKE